MQITNIIHSNEVVRERPGYKHTKLGWIPDDWEIEKVKFFAKVTAGGTPSTKVSEYWKNGDVPWLSSGDLNKREVAEVKGRITEEGLKNSSASLIPVNSILIGLAGQGKTRGTVAFNKIELSTNQSVAAIIPSKSRVFYKYLYFNLQSRYEKIRLLSTGAGGRGGLNLKIINSLLVPIPSLPEQKLISDCLNTWDMAITKLEKLIKAKQKCKKGLMQLLLTGKKRLPGFDGEWEEKRLSEYVEYSPRPVDKPKTSFIKLGIRSHGKGTFQNKDFEPKAIAIDTLYQVKEDDLIVNITFAWEGAIALVTNEDNDALVSHRFPTYTFREDIGNPSFFKQYIMTKRFRFLLELISPGGAGRNRVMSKKDFLKLKITIPDYDEQTAIAQILTAADKEIQLLQKQRDFLKEQKNGMMQQLLTGKKRLINN